MRVRQRAAPCRTSPAECPTTGHARTSYGRNRRRDKPAPPHRSARLFCHTPELASRLGAAYDEEEDLERQTFARLEAALGPELLASELAAGAALSLKDAIDLAVG